MEEHRIDPRHVSRAIALQQLFNHFYGDEGAEAFQNEDLLDVLGQDEFDDSLTVKIITGVKETAEKIDPIIQELAPAWPLPQIAPVDLTILRMGIWEAFIGQTTPARVVINETIELAKEFGGPNSSSFINGVLGSLLNNQDLQSKLTNNVIDGTGEE